MSNHGVPFRTLLLAFNIQRINSCICSLGFQLIMFLSFVMTWVNLIKRSSLNSYKLVYVSVSNWCGIKCGIYPLINSLPPDTPLFCQVCYQKAYVDWLCFVCLVKFTFSLKQVRRTLIVLLMDWLLNLIMFSLCFLMLSCNGLLGWTREN